jgi:hypothetical protein
MLIQADTDQQRLMGACKMLRKKIIFLIFNQRGYSKVLNIIIVRNRNIYVCITL